MQQSKSYKIELQPANTMMCAMQEKTRIYALPMLKRIIFVIDGHNVVDTFRMESIRRINLGGVQFIPAAPTFAYLSTYLS
jgi:hypothetical protein